MTVLKFIDETLRDGPQSLWATRMRTETMLEAAPLLDAAGFSRATVLSGASFETAVKFLKEDPWERTRLVRQYLTDTPVDVLIRGRNLFGWSRYSDDVVELLFKCLQRSGASSVKIFDGLNDTNTIAAHCRIGKSLGLQVTGILTFSMSPVHTDEYYFKKASEFMALGVDSILICDASGILTGERTETLLIAVQAATGNQTPIEFYAHASMGLAHESYRAALTGGVDGVTTAAEPVANGESLPATADIARIASELGISTSLNDAAVQQLDDYMYWAAHKENKPVGLPVAFDPAAYARFVEHQIPGGMISNFRNQLKEIGLLHRLDEVLREAGRVRAELGYPIMVTPFSQFVGVQATFNVIEGERYKTIPNEMRLFALGYYGDSGTPIEPNVLDRLLQGRSQERRPADEMYGEPMLEAFRIQHGPFASDEELLLNLFYGKQSIEAMGREKTVFPREISVKKPLHVLIDELRKETTLTAFRIEKRNKDLPADYMQLNMTFV
jgi:oxaloacetate decarboxylase alpha subunit